MAAPRRTGDVRVVVLADTHVPDFAKRLPDGLAPALRRADLILHAGDVTAPALLDELAEYAPVHVALGNNDGPDGEAWGGREEIHLEVEGVRLAMLHDSGPAKGRERRLRRRFPDADVVVFGHSHIPIDAEAEGLRLFNPGSPTWKRRQPAATYGTLAIGDGRVRARITALR